jgi:Protein of unknown function (DUF3106)
MRRLLLIFALAAAFLPGFAPQCARAQQPHPPRPAAQRRAARQARRQQAAQQKKNNGANANKPSESANHAGANAGDLGKPDGEKPSANAAGSAGKGAAGGRNIKNLPPSWVERLGDRTPEEQERFLRNSEDFNKLPPARQQQIRQNLEKWNRLTPGQQQAMKDRWTALRNMTPEQREHYQKDVFPKMQQMPPARKQAINSRLHALQDMTPGEREKALNDPQFMRGLSPDEQSTLRDLNSLTSPPTP